MKKLGVIGGVGWQGTSAFLEDMRNVIDQEKWPVRPDVLVHFVPLPLEVEADLLVNGNIGEFIPFIRESARKLRDAGVDVIILACNTLHILEEIIREELKGTGIRFLSLRDVVPDFLEKNQLKRVGLIGTSTTITQVFADRLQERGIGQISLPETLQEDLNRAIQCIVTGQNDESDAIQRAVEFMERAGVQAIGCACTDLTNRIQSGAVPVFDTEKLLVKATCRVVQEVDFLPMEATMRPCH